jgi:hypothetical protein
MRRIHMRIPFSAISLIIAALLFWLIHQFGTFGDEQENFVAGWLLTRGFVPYHDFFFHHAPLPYFLSAPFFFTSPDPWLLLRGTMWTWFMSTGVFTFWHVDRSWRWAVGIAWGIFALFAPALHLQMVLAENFAIFSILSLLFLFMSYWSTSQKQAVSTPTLPQPALQFLWISWVVFSWIAVWSTITAILPMAVIGVGLVAFSLRQKSSRFSILSLIVLGFLLHGTLILYFLITQSLHEAIWAIFTYNIQYYFPLRLASSPSTVQFGYLGSLLINFYNFFSLHTSLIITLTTTFLQTLAGIVKFSISSGTFSLPLLAVAVQEWSHIFSLENISALSLLFIMGYFLYSKKILFAGWWGMLIISLRNRETEEFKIAAFYLGIILFLITIAITSHKQKQWKTYSTVIIFLLIWCGIAAPSFLHFQQEKSPIFSLSQQSSAAQLQPFLSSTTTVYALGGNPSYYLLLHKLPAEKYFYYHPWFHFTPSIHSHVVDFLNQNTTVPLIVENEVDEQEAKLNYAPDIIEIVHRRYSPVTPGIYLPN